MAQPLVSLMTYEWTTLFYGPVLGAAPTRPAKGDSMNDGTPAPGDLLDGEIAGPVDRNKLVKQLMKQVENPDNPFDVRATAVHALRVELPALPEVEAADEAYKEAVAAKDTDAYRGYVANLSPKSKAGQQQLQRLRKAVNDALKPPKAERAPRAAAGPKEPKNFCIDGCGAKVHNLFAPGHDAKVHSILLNVTRGKLPRTAIPEGVLPHLKDLSQKWGFATDNNGDLIVPAPPAAGDGAAKPNA